jgi:hypothetical protein
MNQISRKDAQAQGLPKYFTGLVCRRGHIAERYIAGACCQCVSDRKRELYEQNKEKILAYMKVQGAVYRAANPEKRAQNSRTWKENNRERVTMMDRARRLKNPEASRKNTRAHYYRNREQELLRQKEWRMANKGIVNAFTMQRKADMLHRTPAWLEEDDFWVMQQAHEIAAQRTKVFGFAWHVDHILPLRGKKVSGLHVPANLQVIPWVENLRKGNRMEAA